MSKQLPSQSRPGQSASLPLIELHHVFVRFGLKDGRQLQASEDISLSVAAGDMIAIIGESGCGKSTLGRVCLGLQAPTQGAVFFSGQDIWRAGYKMPPELRLGIQVIHQDPFSSLNPVRTVYQTLAPVLRFHKLAGSRRQARQQIVELLEKIGLSPAEQFIDKYPYQLSGGQKQRVSIARATLLKPRVIVADEPVSAVDASLRLAILDLMKQYNREQGIAFVYITHDLATARYFAPQGQLVVMYLGRMVETGQISNCIDTPGHPYLQALLAAVAGSGQQASELPLRSLDMPDPADPPTGCVFHPRCPYADQRCEIEAPELLPLQAQPEHRVACHYRDQLVAPAKRAL